MKYIIKRGSPHQYEEWRRQSPNANYKQPGIPNPPKNFLYARLLEEQGFLCAYTMKGLTQPTCHIEHIKPESVLRQEDEINEIIGSDLDYENLVACFPRENMLEPYLYGARYKDDWWDDDGAQFVSPLTENCERNFTFNINGEIRGLTDAGKKTIEILRLDHPSLTEDRRRTIDEFINGPDRKSPLSTKQTQFYIENICNKSGRSGKFPDFCVAIKHALNQHADNLRKQGVKRKALQAQKNRKNDR
jgi:uncharacterized protein (TIGR02646 family)